MYATKENRKANLYAGIIAALMLRNGVDSMDISKEEFDKAADDPRHFHMEMKDDHITVSRVAAEDCEATGFRKHQDQEEQDDMAGLLAALLGGALGHTVEVRHGTMEDFLNDNVRRSRGRNVS